MRLSGTPTIVLTTGLVVVVVVVSSFTTQHSYDYDLIIIGAGASGLFASGAAAGLFGGKTCLIDHGRTTGGDCTNAACVPSKSWRAKVATQQESSSTSTNNVRAIREYIRETVEMVRARESVPEDRAPRLNNLDLLLVESCHFVGRREVQIIMPNDKNNKDQNASTIKMRRLTAKKFLIATGADPVVPPALATAARNAAIPLATYRTLLNPDVNDSGFWNVLESSSSSSSASTRRKRRRILVVGGGATACELTQSIMDMDSCDLDIVWVAPAILPEEDVILQQAAYDLLLANNQTTTFHLGRLVDIQPNRRPVVQSARDNKTLFTLDEPVDAMLLCIGRRAATRDLCLTAAGVDVDGQGRIMVRPDLRSISSRHVYAAGDCCSMIRSRHRSASQAAWTGFHAVRNLKVPFFLQLGGNSVAQNIPRIIYARFVEDEYRVHQFHISRPTLTKNHTTQRTCTGRS
jgi:pyruvate/2-oxoglutarate dehydrogenase complex dihydrolipoamide dehydrogenase (E3) component